MTAFYPVHVEAHIDPRLSRWQWLFKWLLVIPHFVVLAFLWIAFAVLSFVAFFAILLTGRYPRGIFDFNVGVLRWTWRVGYYAYGALGTDRYPPFSLADVADYPAHLEIDYPERLSRGLVLVKWWLLAVPHYLVVGLFLGGVGWAARDTADTGDTWRAGGTGLISLLVLVAAVVLLFSGRYPRSIFDLVLGLNRWVLRVAAYAALMTDVYPPFRLDQGGDDLAVLQAATGAPPASAAGLPVPDASGGAVPVALGPTRGWTAGRVVALVAGCVSLLASAVLGLGGGALAIADHGLRDHDGFLMSGTTELASDGYAIATTRITLDTGAPSALLPENLLGTVKVRATGGQPVFLGIAPTSDADAYLRGVRHATLTDFSGGPVYRNSGGGAPTTPPAASSIWVAQVSGSGTQELVWPARSGEWTLVMMNADGSADVTARTSAGATVPALDWIVPTLLVGAGVGLVTGCLLLLVAFRRNPAPPATKA